MAIDKNMRVLVVDDMLTMRKVVSKILKEIGFTKIDEADDGIPAWAKIEESLAAGNPYGFVVSDWNMPGMAGIDLLRKVRAHPEVNKTPFLMVTAETEQDHVITAVKEGVSNYIVKPFNVKTLNEKIEKIFK